MVFSSMTFLFAFLPVVVLVYMLSPKQMKNAILLIASLFFYAWGEPRNILLMLLSIGINYVFGRIIEAHRYGRRGSYPARRPRWRQGCPCCRR